MHQSIAREQARRSPSNFVDVRRLIKDGAPVFALWKFKHRGAAKIPGRGRIAAVKKCWVIPVERVWGPKPRIGVSLFYIENSFLIVTVRIREFKRFKNSITNGKAAAQFLHSVFILLRQQTGDSLGKTMRNWRRNLVSIKIYI